MGARPIPAAVAAHPCPTRCLSPPEPHLMQRVLAPQLGSEREAEVRVRPTAAQHDAPSSNQLLDLQGTLGNAAVSRLIARSIAAAAPRWIRVRANAWSRASVTTLVTSICTTIRSPTCSHARLVQRHLQAAP